MKGSSIRPLHMPIVTHITHRNARSRAPFVVGYVSDPKAHKKSYFFVIAQSVHGLIEFTPPFTGVTLFGKRCGAVSDAGLDTDKFYGLQVVYVHNRLPADVRVLWLDTGTTRYPRGYQEYGWTWNATRWYEHYQTFNIRAQHHFLWKYKNLVQCDEDDELRALPPCHEISGDTIMLLERQ